MVRAVVVAVCAVLALARAARAGDDPYADGIRAYQRGDYVEAARLLEEAHALRPAPAIQFALAQSKRLAGDCSGALAHYQALLSDPSLAEDRRQKIREAMAPCVIAPPAAEPALPPTAPPPRAPAPLVAAAADEPPRWYADVAGGALLAGGVAAFTVGGVALARARSIDDALRRGDYEDRADYDRKVDRLAARELTLWIAGGTGVALAAAAFWRYRAVAGRDPARLSIAAGPSYGGFALSGRF